MKYSVWCPDYGEEEDRDAKVMVAVPHQGPREIAEMWAQDRDWSSADFSIVRGPSPPVHVRRAITPGIREGTHPVTVWRVSGEAVPEYTARPEVVGG